MVEKGFNLFTGNRLEYLSRALSTVLEQPVSNAFSQEVVVVQSSGMARWISMELAKHHGISANIHYNFPNAFVYEILRKFSPDIPVKSVFDPEIMTWKIMKHLPDLTRNKEFLIIENYLKGAEHVLKQFQLSEKIADTFDQYLLFRPEMITRWHGGMETHWQAELWRAISAGETGMHRVSLFKAFGEAIKKGAVTENDFPERISVFGISALPEFHMDVLRAVSDFTQINLFLLNPCQEFWGDIISDRELKNVKKANSGISGENNHYAERGNSLLSSMGGLGREFFNLINDYQCNEYPIFESPGGESLLSMIQQDIYCLSDRQKNTNGKTEIDLSDRSIELHSCHSPMREVEVLHDSLYHIFENENNIAPRDIVVMTPDIETYNPFIKAVFDKKVEYRDRIPYSVADRSLKNESPIAGIFLAIIDLKKSRFGISDVLHILETDAVREKYGISASGVETITLWIHDTKIRWGIDGKHRKELGMPEFDENSWVEGLRRMVLGYAMPGFGEKLFHGILPYDNIEGDTSELLGQLCEFTDELFEYVKRTDGSATVEEWTVHLDGLLDQFFHMDDTNQSEIQMIREEIRKLGNDIDLAGFHGEISFSTIRYYFRKRLESRESGYGFITGGITFCAMLPMRSIPFKVICVLGMNSDSYPRQSKSPGFDLISMNPRRGDRSRRKDDRYLFLEIIISARKKLYISYLGRSIKDNSLIQPSVLVSELMDYIETGFDLPAPTPLDFLVTDHPLQPFSIKYFDEDVCKNRLFSYSKTNYLAAINGLNNKTEPLNFMGQELEKPGNEFSKIDINDLCSFFRNPTKFLLQKRLQIVLQDAGAVLEEDEPFDIEGLERYTIEHDLVERMIRGTVADDVFPLIKASGSLPYGVAGEHVFNSMIEKTRAFSNETLKYLSGATASSLEIDVLIHEFRITGLIEDVFDRQLVKYRYALIKGKDILVTWINHLFMCMSLNNDDLKPAVLVGLEKQNKSKIWAGYEFTRVDNPEKELKVLLELYWTGLRKPLVFFPESSYVFAKEFFSKKADQESALKRAMGIWTGSAFSRGEGLDPYYDMCFRNTELSREEFLFNSEAVYKPVFDRVQSFRAER